ncbi:MAG: helix-turn-helix transcriptional regulator, partial [Nitrosopumilus sp.]|nr:helix-turn-helix transcriptional regulator [Nitrosopumilus sp.]
MDNARDLIGEIGANIKTLRLAKGLQQKEVASMTGVSVSQYGRIENGLTKSSIVVLLRMAEALEVSLDMLIYGEKTEIDKEPIVLKDKDLVEKMKQL